MQDQLKSVVRILTMIGIGACTLLFYDMREDIKQIKAKFENHTEEVSKKFEVHSERILTLEIQCVKK